MTPALALASASQAEGVESDSLGLRTGLLGVGENPQSPSAKVPIREKNRIPTLDDLVDHAGELLPDRRVSWCGKKFVKGVFTTDVHYNAEQKRARFAGLARCGDPACIKCAIIRSESEKCEVSWACSDTRMIPILGTFTASHARSDDLKEWGEKFDKALRGLNDKRFQERLRRVYGLTFDIWARDHTAGGVNGHHQHRGQIFFLDPAILSAAAIRDGVTIEEEIREFEVEIKMKFESCLKKTGLTASYSRGFVISAKEHDIKEYIASHGRIPKSCNMKWDIEHELVQNVKKKEHSGKGKHPFELLIESYQGNMRSRALFVQWARFMFRKHSVNWSKGAKDYFLAGERPYTQEQHPAQVGTWNTVISLPTIVFFDLLAAKLVAAFLFEVVESQGNETHLREWLEEKIGVHTVSIDLSRVGMNSPPGGSDNESRAA